MIIKKYMKKSLVISIIIGIAVIAIGYYLISPAFIVKELNEEPIITNGTVLQSSDFVPGAHGVSGSALVVESESSREIKFEDFETINGPNLHVYLASDLNGEDYIDLGELKGTKGSFSYEIDKDIDLTKYNKVLVWCVPFKILFSYADLG